MKRALLSLALLLAAQGALFAQAPAPEGPPAAEPQRSVLDQELEPAPGGYSYNPQGRRDPFVSLMRPVGPQGGKVRPQGLPGFLIQEVALKGVVKTQGGGLGSAAQAGYIAILQGTDGKSYFVTVGQRLFDGAIVAVDASSVSFRQEVTDPLSPVRTRDVRKTLYPTEEARQ
jgi:type IV pilus assembly protein PilP